MERVHIVIWYDLNRLLAVVLRQESTKECSVWAVPVSAEVRTGRMSIGSRPGNRPIALQGQENLGLILRGWADLGQAACRPQTNA